MAQRPRAPPQVTGRYCAANQRKKKLELQETFEEHQTRRTPSARPRRTRAKRSTNKTSWSAGGTPTSSSSASPGSTHSFVGLLLAGVLRGFARVPADLHVHGVDDVEEVLHHGHTPEGQVHGRDPVHTLRTQPERPVSRPRRRAERGNQRGRIKWDSGTPCSLAGGTAPQHQHRRGRRAAVG